MKIIICIEAIGPFRYRKKKKVHRFTNNLQGLQKVTVKDFSINTCHDTAKRAKTGVGFPVIFSGLRCPIEPKFPQDCYFIYKVVIHEVWDLDNTVYRKCIMALIE